MPFHVQDVGDRQSGIGDVQFARLLVLDYPKLPAVSVDIDGELLPSEIEVFLGEASVVNQARKEDEVMASIGILSDPVCDLLRLVPEVIKEELLEVWLFLHLYSENVLLDGFDLPNSYF